MKAIKKNRFYISILFLLACLYFVAGPGPSGWLHAAEKSNPGDTVIAQAGNWKLTYDDIKRIVSYYPKSQQEELLRNPRNVITLVRRLVQAKVLSDKAYSEGFNNRPDIKEQLELFTRDKLASAYVREKVLKGIKVTDQDLRLYYRSHKDKYRLPPMVKVRHILIRLPKNAKAVEVKQARKRIKDILTQLKKGEKFDVLAGMYSEDPGSREKGGELGWLPRNALDPSFAKAAFSAKIGKLVGPVRSAFGLHILEVEARRPAKQLPFDKVKEQVKADLLKELRTAKVRNFINDQMTSEKARINKEELIKLLMK